MTESPDLDTVTIGTGVEVTTGFKEVTLEGVVDVAIVVVEEGSGLLGLLVVVGGGGIVVVLLFSNIVVTR